MAEFVMAHSWDPPQLTQHFAFFQKQTTGREMVPWVKTLCGRSLMANGEREGAEMCEICEDAFDDEDADDE